MEQLIQEIKDYMDLRIKRMKLNVVEQLSVLCGKAVSMVIFALMLFIALLALTAAAVILMYDLIGSLLGAFLIVGGFFLVVALVVFLLRNRMFTGGMVKTFSRMFFTDNSIKLEEDEDDEEY